MRRFAAWRALVGACVAGALLVFGAGSASAQFTGIAFTKGCESPVMVSQPYNCAYSVLNVANTNPDTVTFSAINDNVHTAQGDVLSGNILGALQLVFSDPSVTCVGGTGAGTQASPYVGATMCTLPIHTSITSNPHSFYNVQPADFALPAHALTDTATLTWRNLCNGEPPGSSCNPMVDQSATAGSSATIAISPPIQMATQVLDANNTLFIQGIAPVTVHDLATITGAPGGPPPTGQVVFEFFTNATCTGSPAAIEPPIASPPYSSMPRTVAAAGLYGYVAQYGGDGTYAPSNSPCEPFRVLDANIQIAPLTATNPVGTNHTLTAQVNANDGTGFLPSAGTTVTFSSTGPGAFVPAGASTCTTDASGNCSVTISSATLGMTTVHASADVQVGGVFGGLLVHRETGDGKAGDSPDANKQWVPPTAVIASAQTSCSDVLNGTAVALGEVDYTLANKGTIAQQIDPGTFHFYSTITTTAPNQVVTVSQSNDSTSGAALFELSGPPVLWSGGCASKSNGTETGGGSGASFIVPAPGTYVIALKYRTKSLAKSPAPVPGDVTYTFTTSLGGNTSASVLLKRQ